MTTFLTIAILILLFLAVFYIGKSSELASLVKGDDNEAEYKSKVNGILSLLFGIGFIGIVFISAFWLVPRMLPTSNSVHGLATDRMFNITTLLTFIVFVITQIVLFWFTFRYRYKKGRKSTFFAESLKLELLWTAIPAVAMAILVSGGLKTWSGIFTNNDEEPKFRVEVTAYQFGWKIRYPGKDGKFGRRIITEENINEFKDKYGTPNELGIDWSDPASHDDIITTSDVRFIAGKPTLVTLGALDVLHSFYLPHFRLKMDCVPGTPTSFPFTPIYTTKEYIETHLKGKPYWEKIDPETGAPRYEDFKFELACTELCGKSHYAMQKDVYVVTESEFNTWLEEQKSYYDLVIKPAMIAAGDLEEEIPSVEELDEAEMPSDSTEQVADGSEELITQLINR